MPPWPTEREAIHSDLHPPCCTALFALQRAGIFSLQCWIPLPPVPGFSASSAGSDAGLFCPEFLSGKSAACSPEEPRPDRRVNEASWSAGFGREDQRAFRPGSSVVLEASATGGFRRSTPVLERATEKPHSGRRKPTAQSHYRRPKWGASQGRETGAGIVPSSRPSSCSLKPRPEARQGGRDERC